MSTENFTPATPIGRLLRQFNEGAYFIPKEVKKALTNKSTAPIAAINPWRTKTKPMWWVFECPREEAKYLYETLGLKITHLFVSDRFTARDIDHTLFNYYIGQFDKEDGTWRWVDPAAPEDAKPKLSGWHKGNLVNSWETADDRTSSSWWY